MDTIKEDVRIRNSIAGRSLCAYVQKALAIVSKRQKKVQRKK